MTIQRLGSQTVSRTNFTDVTFTRLLGLFFGKQKLSPSTTYEFVRLTLRAGDSGGIASTSLLAAEVGSVVQAVGQRHLSTRAANATHHHSVCTNLPRPIPRLLLRKQPGFHNGVQDYIHTSSTSDMMHFD